MFSDEQVVAIMAAILMQHEKAHNMTEAIVTIRASAYAAQDLFDAVRAERARRAKERGE